MFTLLAFSSLLTFNVTGYWIVRIPFPSLLIRQPRFFSSPSFARTFVLTTEIIERSHLLLTSNAVITPNKMHRFYIASGILLIIPIINFAVAVPVPVQANRHAPVDMELMPGDAITMLGKRVYELDDLMKAYKAYVADPETHDNQFANMKLLDENYFAKPEESPAARPSSSSPPSGAIDEWTDVGKPLQPIPEEPPTAPIDHGLTGMRAPLSNPVLPSWFHPDSESMGTHAPKPNSGPSNPGPSTVSDSNSRLVVGKLSMPASPLGSFDDLRLVAEEPPSTPSSPTKLGVDHEYEMVDAAPSGPVSSKNPGRRSMGTNSRLENLLKGNAKESRHISGTARGVLNAA
jgi:hypothetical protein